MVIPLLSLPGLIQKEIARSIPAPDLFNLMKCSKRTKNTLRFFERSNRIFKLRVDFNRNCVEIRQICKYNVLEANDAAQHLESMTFDGEVVRIADAGDNEIDTFWPVGERTRGTMKIVEHFRNDLGICTLDQMCISEADAALEILHWADNCKFDMDNFELGGAENVALAEKIFSTDFLLKVNVNFTSFLEVPKEFRPTHYDTDRLVPMKKFLMHNAYWFTIDHLLVMRAKAIILYECTIKAEDINKFLTTWNEDSRREIYYVALHLTNKINLEDVLKGLVDQRNIDRSVDGKERALFTRPGDGRTMRVEVKDDCKTITADVFF